MSDTFSQLYIQLVFSPKFRQALIDPEWENELYKYITGVVQDQGQKMLAINGMPDHIHVFFSMKPTCTISNLVKDIKLASADFIVRNKLCPIKFRWQNGFGAFSYSKSHVYNAINYVLNQKEHHQSKTFRKEYHEILREHEIEFKDEYLFEFFE